MAALEALFADALFRLASITWLQIVDLILVALVFYFLLHLVRHSRAAFLFQGALALILGLFVITIFLPLPAFDWLVRSALTAILVATPILFQPELRRFMERIGRTLGQASFQQRVRETTLPPLIRAVGNLTASHVGGLIVLEGNDELGRMIETGVPVDGQVSSELLQTIFFEGTPLHDGAVIVRRDEVVAAGCVLPVSDRQLYAGERRLGMRHRAALGLSEVTDALSIVVSEETGETSVARDGQLHLGLDNTALREHLADFFRPRVSQRTDTSMGGVLRQLTAQIRGASTALPLFQISWANLRLGLASILLALATWAFIIQQTNPARQTRIENISLRLEDIPAGTVILSEDVPETVSAVVKTTDNLLPSLRASSFQASVSLAGLAPNVHRLEVTVQSGVSPIQIISVEPDVLDIALARIISQTMPVAVSLVGENALSPAYQVQGAPTVSPTQITVTGAEPVVALINRLQTNISIAGATTSVQQVRPVQALDDQGNSVDRVTLLPAEVQVAAIVARRPDSKIVGVRVTTEGNLPAGYQIRRLSAQPSNLILIGDLEGLAAIGSAVGTVPIDVSQITDDLTIDIPLALPDGVEALNSNGEQVVTVEIEIDVIPQTGTLPLSRTVEIVGAGDNLVSVEPLNVELILAGPQPLLAEIEANPNLVRVIINLANLDGLNSGQTMAVTPELIAPEGITGQLIPDTVQVTAGENGS